MAEGKSSDDSFSSPSKTEVKIDFNIDQEKKKESEVFLGPKIEHLHLANEKKEDFLYLSVNWCNGKWNGQLIRLQAVHKDDKFYVWVYCTMPVSENELNHCRLDWTSRGWERNGEVLCSSENCVSADEAAKLFLDWLQDKSNVIVVASNYLFRDSNKLIDYIDLIGRASEFQTKVKGFINAACFLEHFRYSWFHRAEIFRKKFIKMKHDLEKMEFFSYTTEFLRRFVDYNRQSYFRRVTFVNLYDEGVVSKSKARRISNSGLSNAMLQGYARTGNEETLMNKLMISNKNIDVANYFFKCEEITLVDAKNIINKIKNDMEETLELTG